MTQNLTNEEALNALGIFEKCQPENLNLKLKYAMARNAERLKSVKKAFTIAKDVSGDENCKAFLTARKKFLDGHKGQPDDTINEGLQNLEMEFADARAYIGNKENEVREWLASEVEGIEIFKIPLSSFPADTTIDLGKIFAFIGEE